MKLNVRVVPNSSTNLVTSGPNGSLKVKLTSPPEKGKANKHLVELLAKHYKVSRSKVRLVSGLTSRNKVVEVLLG
jgi:hypothetical protein